MKSSYPRTQQGFTLIEVMVALAAGTLIMILFLASFRSLSTFLTTSECYRKVHNEIRHAIDLMQRDITRGSEVTQCTATNRLALTAPETGSSTNLVSVVYNLTDTTLFRTEDSGPAEQLATDVKGITFILYDLSGTSTTNPANAYFVGVEIEAQRDAVLHSHEDQFRTRARLRAKDL